MIIECEGCRSKFSLDESLLKQEGSKVRCSVCKKIFTAYPPEPETPADKRSGRIEMEETVALDSPPILAERGEAVSGEARDADFDKAFQQALEEESPPPGMDAIPGEGMQLGDKDEENGDLTLGEPEAGTTIIRPEKKKSFRLMPVVLVLFLIVIAGSAAVYFFAPDLLPDSLSFLKAPQKGEISDVGVARLSFANVKGGFVKSEKEGQLFVIQGMVTNSYPKGRKFILLRGSLLDDKGQVVRTKMAYAGNLLAEEQVKTMTLEEISKEMKNRAGRNNANTRIEPQGQIPFSIVIENLPENLTEFTVEAVSSSPEQP
jgi:predicted Zn finger-like uncharacterized protein